MSERYARLSAKEGEGWARLESGEARFLDRAPWLPGVTETGARVVCDDEGRGEGVSRLAPASPTKIICVGRNYHAHAKELGNEVPKEPLLFLKPPSSLLEPGGTLLLPPTSLAERVDHEAEVTLVVGRRARGLSREDALDAVFGVTAACDVTARDLQKKDSQWTRAKGMDGFCPVGPVVVRGVGAAPMRIRCRVNGELRQDGSTEAMIFSFADVLAYVSRCITLEPGDLILTGTPEGVGPLRGGDHLAVELEGVGTLDVRVAQGAY